LVKATIVNRRDYIESLCGQYGKTQGGTTPKTLVVHKTKPGIPRPDIAVRTVRTVKGTTVKAEIHQQEPFDKQLELRKLEAVLLIEHQIGYSPVSVD